MRASPADMRSRGPGAAGLGWVAIFRLGLIQACLGAIVVLTTSTLNRVMIVELGLAALIPGLLVGIHYAVQISRPLWGHWSDTGGSRTSWILGGLGLLAVAGTAASATTLLFEQNAPLAFAAACLAYVFIGIGIGACGTSLLALMASRTAPGRRASAATLTWMLMIAGIVVTSIVTGHALEPYSHERLIAVTAGTGAVVLAIASLAIAGIERRAAVVETRARAAAGSFAESFRDVWTDPAARLFTVFVFLSMLAYSMQDLVLEPYAGLLFAMTPGESTRLSGTQHGGVLLGMALVGLSGLLLPLRWRLSAPRVFIIAGCAGSALALSLLSLSTLFAPDWPLSATVFALGVANGAFAVAAVGTMMVLAGDGQNANEGVRMGVWGAAQAVAFGLGGVLGTLVLDLGRLATGSDGSAFALVFGIEAGLFVLSALLALGIGRAPGRASGQVSHSRQGAVAAE